MIILIVPMLRYSFLRFVLAVGSEHSFIITSGKLAIIITKGNLKKRITDSDLLLYLHVLAIFCVLGTSSKNWYLVEPFMTPAPF